MSDINYSRYAFTPHESAMAGYNEAKRARENQKSGFNFPVVPGADIHEYFARMMPWEVCEILAQTHNGKTTLVDWWEGEVCKQFAQEGRDEVVVHVSLEESLEAMSFYQHSKILKLPTSMIASGEVDEKRLQFSTTEIDKIPIYRIAESTTSYVGEDEPPTLYLTNIYRIIRAMQTGHVTGKPIKIGALFVDYLQALPYDPETRRENEEGKRRIQVRKDVYRLRQMTVHIPCPIVVNVQAKQKLEGSNPPYHIPGVYDGEETSSIAQRFDRIISIWMPKMNYPIGSYREGIGNITDSQMFIKVAKQRGGFPSGKVWETKWDFANHKLLSAFGKTVSEKAEVKDYTV